MTKEDIEGWVQEHPKTSLAVAVALTAVIIWALWCSIPPEYRTECSVSEPCPTCFINPADEQCYGFCAGPYHECLKQDGVCVCQEQY